MTVLYSHLVIVPTHPVELGLDQPLRGCPVAEPAVPPRRDRGLRDGPGCCSASPLLPAIPVGAFFSSAASLRAAFPVLPGMTRFVVLIFAATWLARIV
jgi:hypothetical protein